VSEAADAIETVLDLDRDIPDSVRQTLELALAEIERLCRERDQYKALVEPACRADHGSQESWSALADWAEALDERNDARRWARAWKQAAKRYRTAHEDVRWTLDRHTSRMLDPSSSTEKLLVQTMWQLKRARVERDGARRWARRLYKTANEAKEKLWKLCLPRMGVHGGSFGKFVSDILDVYDALDRARAGHGDGHRLLANGPRRRPAGRGAQRAPPGRRAADLQRGRRRRVLAGRHARGSDVGR